MSPHDPPAVAVDAHDADHGHDDDDVSGEPRTPLWLPLVGGVLFLGALMFMVATRPPGKTADELSKEAQERNGAAAQPAATAPTPAPAAAPQPQMPVQPGGCGQPQPGAQPGGCGQPQPGGCGG